MERYLLFQYDIYYPSGGMADLQGSFHTIDEIKKFLENTENTYDHTEVIDTHTPNWDIVEI